MKYNSYIIIFLIIILNSCKKLVEIPEPINTITTSAAFSTNEQANSVLAGIYSRMINTNNPVYSNGAISIYSGLSSDELIEFAGPSDAVGYQFYKNDLLSTNAYLNTYIWQPAYASIYSANSAVTALELSTSGLLQDSVRKELIGEAKFIRAFSYFYLTNLFGDLPLVLTTDFNKISTITRSSQGRVYEQITKDLSDAQELLPEDFSVGRQERIRPNKWTAIALLARVYLYRNLFDSAAIMATQVINNTQFRLSDAPDQVFNSNSTEAIWQLQQNVAVAPNNATYDGLYFLPAANSADFDTSIVNQYPSSFIPVCYVSDYLVNSFEPDDTRRLAWISSATVLGKVYYYPHKYIVNQSQLEVTGSAPQYYTILRLAEQFLIRAEARANEPVNDFAGAIEDLNIIRVRANLPPYTGPQDKSSVLQAILHERQIEFFAEWGNRWLDLKRTGRAETLLSDSKKMNVNQNALLYPLPSVELSVNPNLSQNNGYN